MPFNNDEMMPMLPPCKVTVKVQMLAELMDYNIAMMNVPELWKETMGKGVKVAVLDTGRPQHNDIHPTGGKSFIPGYEFDAQGHGSHVAGIIAAIAGNDMGVCGIAPDCEDYYGTVLSASGSGSVNSIVSGIRWAVDEVGAKVINMSLGIPAGAPLIKELEEACNYANKQGVTVVCAAGNEAGSVGQPAKYDSVISVAAVNDKKEHAKFSNVGPEVDFACGGVNVYSTYLNNGFVCMSGTSMSAPALSGLVSLILAHGYSESDEWLSPDEVYNMLKDMAFDVGDEGFDQVFGNGIPVFRHGDLCKRLSMSELVQKYLRM